MARAGGFEGSTMSNATHRRYSTCATLLSDVRDPTNHRAWEAFLDQYGPMVRAWCRRWFPHCADDMAHEVYVRLVFAMRTYRYMPERGRFRGWLKTTTHRLMAELKRDADRACVGDGDLDRFESPPDPRAVLAGRFDLERLDLARAAVRGRVEPRTWSAYVETAERGRKAPEVAGDLGMNVGAVYQAKHSVLTALRREVAASEGFESHP